MASGGAVDRRPGLDRPAWLRCAVCGRFDAFTLTATATLDDDPDLSVGVAVCPACYRLIAAGVL